MNKKNNNFLLDSPPVIGYTPPYRAGRGHVHVLLFFFYCKKSERRITLMALIKYGGGIIQASGSIAGTTHARNRFGNYIRARTKPVNPNSTTVSKLAFTLYDADSANQAKTRAAMAALSYKWSQVLTSAQRTAWNLYASSVAMKNRLGEVVYLTGYNHYIRSNIIRGTSSGNSYDDGPTIFELPEKDPTIAVVPVEHDNNIRLTFDDTMEWVDEDGAVLWIWQGSPQNKQRNFFGGPYLGLKDKAGSSGTPKTSPESFGFLIKCSEGQRVWCKFRIQRADGRLSEPFFASGICIA